jgi:DNA-binding XRE family transcriptional regulator
MNDVRSADCMLLEQERYVPSLVLAMRVARVFGARVEEVLTLGNQ